MNIEYRDGDLFTVPPHSILVHSCNAKGVWGAGIAKQFKARFPHTHQQYVDFCKSSWTKSSQELVGQVFIFSENNYRIASLITSNGYGHQVDSSAQILQATQQSLLNLIEGLDDHDTIHMPKINSGLFRTPWSETEKCIEYLLSHSSKNIKCVVWTKESKDNEEADKQSNNEWNNPHQGN